MDAKTMTTEDLKKALADANGRADAARAEAKTLAAEIQERANVAGFEALPEAKKRALTKHIIAARGIPSAEAVGTPGRK